MEIRRKVFSAIDGDEKLYSTTEFDMSYNEAGEKIFSKREDRREAKKAERKKWNYGEHVGSVLTKGGLTTAAVGGGTALAGGGAALGAAIKQKERAAIISGTAAHLGAKAARIGLGVAAAGVATKAIAKAARKSKEEAKKEKDFSDKEDKSTKVVLHLTPRDLKELEREKKKRENEKYKLKPGDSINKAVNYGLMKKDGVLSDLEKDRIQGNTKKNVKNAAIAGALTGAVTGGTLSKIAGGSTKHVVANAGIAGAGFAAASAAGAGLGSALRHKIEKGDGKFSKKYKKDWEKQSDLLDLHEGRMTKKEFVKKWGGKIDGKKVKGSENE